MVMMQPLYNQNAMPRPLGYNPPTGYPMTSANIPMQASLVNPVSDAAIIQQAKKLLGEIQNLPLDEAYMRHLGVPAIFHNGQEALQTINQNGIKVAFGDMGDSPAHAQWMADQHLIMINARYRGDNSPATLYAISEAMYHEAGHAARIVSNPSTGQRQNLSLAGLGTSLVGDDQSSIQEETECLALNTMAHRYHEAISPAYAQVSSSSALLRDGVQLYTRLFFDPDPYKKALINRIVLKYGDLPLSSPGHEAPFMGPNLPLPIAYRVLTQTLMQAITMPAANFQAGLLSNNAPSVPPTPRVSYLA